jgi:hypothetical protein
VVAPEDRGEIADGRGGGPGKHLPEPLQARSNAAHNT